MKGLFTFSYCGLPLLSNINLPELEHASLVRSGYAFYLKSPIKQIAEYPWTHHWRDLSGEISLSYCKQGPFQWLRFPGLADFCLAAGATEISCYPLPETSRESIEHLLLDQVLPRCLANQGKVMLHASAVRLKAGLILFIGDSGAGKSTLAGNFHQAGNPAVSDDCLWIKASKGQVKAGPTYGGLRLWDDSLQALFSADQVTTTIAHYTTKKRVPLDECGRLGKEGLPVLAVILLAPVDQVSTSAILLERLSRREAFIAMLKQTFQLDVTDLQRMTRHIKALGRIVPKVRAYRLSMPREYAMLPKVRERILEEVEMLPGNVRPGQCRGRTPHTVPASFREHDRDVSERNSLCTRN
jgi:hypothetical protein